MHRYSVLCQTATGRDLAIVVQARSDESACRAALRRAESESPGAGWLAVHAVRF